MRPVHSFLSANMHLSARRKELFAEAERVYGPHSMTPFRRMVTFEGIHQRASLGARASWNEARTFVSLGQHASLGT